MNGWRAAALLLCVATHGAALAAEIHVLSGGAIEPGVRPVIAAFEKASGHTVALSFATAPRPDISSAPAFTRALLDADSLVFNLASTGVYFEGLLKKLGLEAATAPKTTRYADGAADAQAAYSAAGLAPTR